MSVAQSARTITKRGHVVFVHQLEVLHHPADSAACGCGTAEVSCTRWVWASRREGGETAAICEVTSSSQVTDSSDMALVIVLCVCFRCCSVISGLTASAEAPLTVVQH